MAIVYSTAIKDARMGIVRAAIDGAGGSPTPGGRLQIWNSGLSTLLAEITLALPCGIVATGVLTFTTPQVTNSIANGTAATARLVDGDGTVIASGLTVGTVGTNVLLNSAFITSGETLTITSATLTHG